MADADLTTAATAASVLGISAADPHLPRLIGAASEAIRNYLGRPQLHYSAAYVEKLPGLAAQVRLYLGLPAVASVASVVLPGGSALDSDEFTLELAAGALYRAAGWPYTGLVQPGLLYDVLAVGTEAESITVTYAGGWVTPDQAGIRTLPFVLEEACLQAVSALYRRQGTDPNVASEALGDYSVSYRSPNTIVGVGIGGLLPDQVLAQLGQYRRLVA